LEGNNLSRFILRPSALVRFTCNNLLSSCHLDLLPSADLTLSDSNFFLQSLIILLVSLQAARHCAHLSLCTFVSSHWVVCWFYSTNWTSLSHSVASHETSAMQLLDQSSRIECHILQPQSRCRWSTDYTPL